jgi:hypothetical protein
VEWWQNGPPEYYDRPNEPITLKDRLRKSLEEAREKQSKDQPTVIDGETGKTIEVRSSTLPTRPSLPSGGTFSAQELALLEHDAWTQIFRIKLKAFIDYIELQAADELAKEHKRLALALWREIVEELERNKDLPGIEETMIEVMDNFMRSAKDAMTGWI